MQPTLHIRAYQGSGALHSHDFVQIVLPIHGALEIEIGGRGERLSSGLSAFVASGEIHMQAGRGVNRSLVLDAPEAEFPPAVVDRLGRGRFFMPHPEVQHLVEFASLRCATVDPGDDKRSASHAY